MSHALNGGFSVANAARHGSSDLYRSHLADDTPAGLLVAVVSLKAYSAKAAKSPSRYESRSAGERWSCEDSQAPNGLSDYPIQQLALTSKTGPAIHRGREATATAAAAASDKNGCVPMPIAAVLQTIRSLWR